MPYTTVPPTATGSSSSTTSPVTGAGSTSGVTAVSVIYFDLWLPQTLVQATDPLTLNVHDISYTRQPAIDVILTPMMDTEKITLFGRMDVRTARALTRTDLDPGSILVNPATPTAPDTQPEAWMALTHSDEVPGQVRLRTLVRRIDILPVSVAAGY